MSRNAELVSTQSVGFGEANSPQAQQKTEWLTAAEAAEHRKIVNLALNGSNQL